jgi:DNA helicase-2/ATP-dependent DNA helicase PcrA
VFLKIKDDNDEIIAKIYKEYEKQLRAENTLDFDDLLLLPHILFKNKKDVLQKWKEKFKYILVDEAQDTNKIQFELVYMLSGADGNITLI